MSVGSQGSGGSDGPGGSVERTGPDGSGGSVERTGSGGSGRRYEIVIHTGRSRVWVARAQRLGRRSRTGLHRVRAYLQSPEGQRATVRSVQAVAVVGVSVAGVVVLRRWLGALGAAASAARRAAAAMAGGARRVFGAMGSLGRGTRSALSLRWVGSLLRWLTFGRVAGRACPCPDCHARVRRDAAVCHRCGYRPGRGILLGDVTSRRGVIWGPAVWTGRVLALRLRRRCPDCRRGVHADARVCRSCGLRLRG
jgi:hypothetical protein